MRLFPIAATLTLAAAVLRKAHNISSCPTASTSDLLRYGYNEMVVKVNPAEPLANGGPASYQTDAYQWNLAKITFGSTARCRVGSQPQQMEAQPPQSVSHLSCPPHAAKSSQTPKVYIEAFQAQLIGRPPSVVGMHNGRMDAVNRLTPVTARIKATAISACSNHWMKRRTKTKDSFHRVTRHGRRLTG